MNITSIASSSAGNAHIIESGGYQLILDMGVPLSRIREALNHDLSKVVGCLVSHEHMDHCSGLSQLVKGSSIPIFCSEKVKEACGIGICDTFEFQLFKWVRGCFNITPISLVHDTECFGFFIFDIKTRKKLLYATDTGEINYTIPGLTHLMIEANYSFDRLIDSEVNTAARKRIAETHLSIDQVVEFVSRHKELEEIHLLHLSDGHSDAIEFKRMVQDVAAVPVYVANK
jgi:phosphoribosyl 1,2-cyclic phosphodiesterase